jgi:hypothetical protein
MTDEQRLRVERNRVAALEKKKQAEEARRCAVVDPETGTECGSKDIVDAMWNDFGEMVCASCKALRKDDFALINKGDSMSRYLVSDDTMKVLKFTTKPNPRNSMFAPMKLYLVKHVREKAMKRWGDEQGLLNELDRREKERFERGLRECEDALVVNDGDGVGEGDGGGDDGGDDGGADKPLRSPFGTGKRKRDSKKKETAASKQAKSKLGSMLSAIKG